MIGARFEGIITVMGRHPNKNGSAKKKISDAKPVDVYVGRRMAERRTQLGVTQQMLAKVVGVSFQAIQKYEAGEVRISASRLYDISKNLGVPPSYFFDGYQNGTERSKTKSGKEDRAGSGNRLRTAGGLGDGDISADELAMIIRGYLNIQEPEARANILSLILKLGSQQQN